MISQGFILIHYTQLADGLLMNCYPSLKRCFYNVVILLIRFIPSINLIFNAPKAKDTYYQRFVNGQE